MSKKYITIIAALAMALALPFVSSAESQDDQGTPPVSGRPDLKTRVDARIENNERNRMIRGQEVRGKISDMKGEIKGEREDMRKEIKEMRLNDASSTEKMMLFKRDMKETLKKKMESRTFEIRKNALIKELTVALRNLDSIDERVKSRLDKVTAEGKDVTKIKALLATAEEKLAKAKTDVQALNSITLPAGGTASTTPTASTSPEIDLAKPRMLGDAAIKSVKEARDAFKKVVVEIAHTMGNGDEKEGTTTQPTI